LAQQCLSTKLGVVLPYEASAKDVTQLQCHEELLTINKHNQLHGVVSRYSVINNEKAVN
jgi:hypothetical protein